MLAKPFAQNIVERLHPVVATSDEALKMHHLLLLLDARLLSRHLISESLSLLYIDVFLLSMFQLRLYLVDFVLGLFEINVIILSLPTALFLTASVLSKLADVTDAELVNFQVVLLDCQFGLSLPEVGLRRCGNSLLKSLIVDGSECVFWDIAHSHLGMALFPVRNLGS